VAAIDLVLIREQEKPRLWSMLQRYLAELSTLGGAQAVAGEFQYRYFEDYWRDPERWPFWITSDGQVAGFALVRRRDDGVVEMAEFFIAAEHRRSGIGSKSARALFARFPGRWHLSEFRQNHPAISFWRTVLRGFAAYEETAGEERIEQSFELSNPH